MGKKIKIILVSAALIFIFALCSSAEGEYSLVYDYGIASAAENSVVNNNPDFYTGGTATPLSAPSCPGFTFDGWYTDDNYTERIENIGADITGNMRLFAKWYEERYSINYILTSQDFDFSEENIDNPNVFSRLTTESVHLTDPTYRNNVYIFEGWYTDADFTEKTEFIPEYTCRGITLYAKWSKAVYRVRYDLGDISLSLYPTENPNPEAYEYGSEINLLPIKTSDPSFTFDGWYYDELFTRPADRIEQGATGGVILYAKWTRAVYNINYVLSDGTVDEKSIHNYNPATRIAAEEIVLSSPSTDDRNFTFDGWYTSPDFSESSKITVISAYLSEDITLYAKWVQAVYKITYDYGDMNLLMRPIDNKNPTEYRFGDSITLTEIEADGFIFNGWCTDSALKNKISGLPEGSFGDITLYADFTEKTYAVNYVLSTREDVLPTRVINNNQSIRTTSQGINLESASLLPPADFEFDGWYLDSAFTERVREIRPFTTENITLYAKWVRIVSYLPVWGDVTLSDKLTAADARIILRYSAKLETDLTEMQLKVSDINNDSVITAADARLALRLSARIDKEEDIIERYSLPTIELVDGEVVFTKK